jgi:YidC/Oxa1 family membrane protein insertase
VDKKNTFIGVLLIAAAFACYFLSSRYAPQNPTPAAIRQAVARQEGQAPAQQPAAFSPEPRSAFASTAGDHAGATITRLENDYIQVRFTDFGGAIRDVALKKYPAALGRSDPFVFNELHKDPMLAFVDADMAGLDRGTRFELVSKSASEIVFRAILDGRLEVTRRYVLSPNQGSTTDPYQIHHETVFRNLTDRKTAPLHVKLALGTAAPQNALDTGLYLTTGYSNGGSSSFMRRSQLEGGRGFLGMSPHDPLPQIENAGPLKWAAVSSQFFASILTPSDAASSLVTRRVKLLSLLPDTDDRAYGITADAGFDVAAIDARGQARLSADLYVGPKEYPRLSDQDVFKANQEKVMQYGGWFITFFAGLLIKLMTWVHFVIPNWGLAIICTTLILKFVFLPLTLISARSARRMQKIQPELKAIREKHKENPQKQQTATMELFKLHKVNPMGGCIPMLLTIPFFIGFYQMLRSTAELRFAPFLWAHDLSAPDTIGHVLGYQINILPILFTATSFIQMQITPQPTVDSSQAKMMKFMPLIFMFIYYGFSCSLSLYSTVNGIFTIVQQLIINRAKDDGDPTNPLSAAAVTGPRGKPLRNVTPGKRK